MQSNKFSWFLMGLGAGAAVAALITPKTGKDARRYIRRRVDDGQEFVERSASKAQDVGADLLDMSRKTAKRANAVINDVVDAGRSAVSAFR